MGRGRNLPTGAVSEAPGALCGISRLKALGAFLLVARTFLGVAVCAVGSAFLGVVCTAGSALRGAVGTISEGLDGAS